MPKTPRLSGVLGSFLAQMGKGISGDVVFQVRPATWTPKPTSAAWTAKIEVALVDAAGNIHTWFNKAIANGVSVADTSSAGTATIGSTTLTFVNGVATVALAGNAQAWLNSETVTVTVAQQTICGTTCAQKTSVATFTT